MIFCQKKKISWRFCSWKDINHQCLEFQEQKIFFFLIKFSNALFFFSSNRDIALGNSHQRTKSPSGNENLSYNLKSFSFPQKPKKSVDFWLKQLQWDKETISLQLWDIAGHEVSSFKQIFHFFQINEHKNNSVLGQWQKFTTNSQLQLWLCLIYRVLQHLVCSKKIFSFFLFFFDSFWQKNKDNVKKWRDDINDKVMLGDGTPIPMILMANKCDMPDIHIDKEKMSQFCQVFNFIWFFSFKNLVFWEFSLKNRKMDFVLGTKHQQNRTLTLKKHSKI